MSKQPTALRLADALELDPLLVGVADCAAAELRRLYEANEAFGKRQEWWNERMFALEKQRDELLEALKGISEASPKADHKKLARAAIAKVEGKK